MWTAQCLLTYCCDAVGSALAAAVTKSICESAFDACFRIRPRVWWFEEETHSWIRDFSVIWVLTACMCVCVCLSACLTVYAYVCLCVCVFMCSAAVLRSDVGQGSSGVCEAAETRKQICQEHLEHCWGLCHVHGRYRVAQLKWGQLTFLMVTFECVGRIQQFLVNVITVFRHTPW